MPVNAPLPPGYKPQQSTYAPAAHGGVVPGKVQVGKPGGTAVYRPPAPTPVAPLPDQGRPNYYDGGTGPGPLQNAAIGAASSLPGAPRQVQAEMPFDFESAWARASSKVPNAPPPAAPPPTDTPSASAFARAKDQQGLLARSAIDSLHEQMAGRGMSGSSIEGRELANVVGGTAQNLSETVRDEAIVNARRAQDVSDRNLNYGLAVRGQDIDATNARQNQILSIMSLLKQTGRAY